MSSQPPLSPAELAAAEALRRHFAENNTLGIESLNPDDFAEEARAVVAAVRGPLLHEAADRMLQHATEAENHDATESAVYTFMVAADRLRDWACRPLSRPTSEETTQ